MPIRMIVIRSLRYLLVSVVAGSLVAATSVLAEEQLSLPSPTESPSGGRPSLLMPLTRPVTLAFPSKTTGDLRLDDNRIRIFGALLAFGMSQHPSRACWRRSKLARNPKMSQT
jgi:hypothetical protein